MSYSRLWHLLFAVGFLYGIAMTCYSDTPSKKIDDELFKDWVAWLKNPRVFRGGRCADGCFDFEITCAKSFEVSKVDALNGITERKRFGMTFIVKDKYEKYSDGWSLADFVKTNGVWSVNTGDLLVDVINCDYGQLQYPRRMR